MKVVDVSNAAGNAVGQFAGHAVFRDVWNPLGDAVVQFARDVAAHCCRQRGEAGAFRQFARVFRKVQTQRCEIVFFTGHGVAQDYARAFEI